MAVHPTAVVHPQAKIPVSVEVGPYCVIGAGVELGEECVLQHHVNLEVKPVWEKEPLSSLLFDRRPNPGSEIQG